MIIHEIANKCKSDKVFMVTLVILVGMGAFGLGRLSKIESLRPGISIEAPASVIQALNEQNSPKEGLLEANNDILPSSNEGLVVASKSGTKYHFPWCSGAKTIAEKNKIWFDSIEKARVAGYTPASNCKGLK